MKEEQLERVSANIRTAVIEFCKDRLRRGRRAFYIDELGYFVRAAACVSSAPDSPGRILRDLRKDGIVIYRVVSRAKSLYEVLSA